MKLMELMDITIRDAQQCLWATRMSTAEMAPIARSMDEAGFFIIDLTGGAAIDSSVMYLAEDPFERIRVMRRLMPKTPLNFNSRGQSVFRWMQYPDDVAEFTLALLHKNGIRSVMLFDPLNDMRNLKVSVEASQELGLFVIGAVVYTISPVHTIEHFVRKAKDLVDMGVDALELKDPSGLLTPERARELIPALRKVTAGKAQLQLHSHCTYGHGIDTYIEAMNLADDGVDLMHGAVKPLAYGWSLPPHDELVSHLAAHGYETRVGLDTIAELSAYFSLVAAKSKRPVGQVLPVRSVEGDHQVPGGMMSNLVNMLKEQKQEHRLPEVLEEIVRVREELGYPIMVSPMSQYVGTQAVFNVLTGRRYQIVPQEIRQYVLGYYGELAGPVDPDVRQLVAGDEEGITVRPGELLEPMVERFRRDNGPFTSDEEMALSLFYAPQTLKEHRQARLTARQSSIPTSAAAYLVRELLNKPDLEFIDVRKRDFHFSSRLAAS